MISTEQGSQKVRITGRIERAVTPGWWIVRDSRGRMHRAASTEFWHRGTPVVVVGGQIVAQGARDRNPVRRLV